MTRRLGSKVSRILKKLDVAKRKPGKPPQYMTGRFAAAFDDELERPHRTYNSSLSTPGRICHTPWCHAFVAGPFTRPCPTCGGTK